MGDKFDLEAALKENPEHEVAQYLAQQHGIDRDAFLKEGHTDAEFIKEFGAMPLPSNVEQTNNAVTSPTLKPSATVNAMAGAVAAGVPLTLHGIKSGVQSFVVGDALKQLIKNQQPAKVVPPSVPGGGLQSYLNGHLLDQGFHGTLPVDNLSKAVYGEFGKIQTPSDVQDALKIIKGSPAQRVPVTRPGGTIYRDIPAVERIDLTPHLTPIPPPPKPSGREKLANVLSNPTAKKFATGYNAADYLQSEHTPEKVVAGIGTVAPWIEKIVPQKYKQSAKILGGGISALAPAFNSVLHNLYNPEKPVEEHASGGAVGLDMLNEYTAPMMGGLKQAYNSPVVQKTMGIGNKGLQGLGMMSAFSVPENIKKGEYVDAGVNTLNAAASAAAMMPKLAAKIGAAGLARAFPPLTLYEVLKPGTLNTGEDEALRLQRLNMDRQARENMRAEVDSGFEHLPRSVVFKHAEGGPIQHFDTGSAVRTGKKIIDTAEKLLTPKTQKDIPLSIKYGYDTSKIAKNYPDVIPPVLATDPKTGKEFLQKQLSPEALGVQKARKEAQKQIDAGNYNPFFDVNQRYYVDPSFYPTAGRTSVDIVPKKADTIAKYTELANNPESLARLRAAFEKAKDRPAAKDWYAMGQLEDAFIKELGPVEGRKQFKARFADAMAATTGGADPNSNLMMSAYTNYKKALGQEIPTTAADLPFPIGGRFVSGNMEQAKKLADLGQIPVTNPKRHNFSANFLGHRNVSTLDEQMSQLWDPKMMSPPPNAYGIYEQALAREAKKAGVNPVNFQDIAWAGAKDYPGKPMMQEINEMLARTSKITGQPQEDILKGFIRADRPMYGIGITAGAGTALNGQDEIPKGNADGGLIENFQVGGLAKAKHSISQIPEVAKALEAYLKGNISNAERINIMNQYLPIRKWSGLPPGATDEEIRNALMSNKQPLALADVPAGMRVGNRLDIPAYTQKGVYVDTVHDINDKNKPISYNRTGHLTDVDFSSLPNSAVRMGLGTAEQALTPLGAEIGKSKAPIAMIKGTNVGTRDDEVRRMLEEYLKDPRWTQIGMDPRRHSQFFDKSTGLPVFSAEQKLQSGPLVMVPKQGLETSHWEDPRLELKDFPKKHYAEGGEVGHFQAGGLSKINTLLSAGERLANKAKAFANRHPDVPDVMYHGTAADINQFVPKQAGATFLSPTPKFAGDFSDASENYLAKDMLKKLYTQDEDKFGSLKKAAIRIANKNGTNWGDELETLARNQLPTRANILPLHVNATNPFDFQNQKHLDALKNELLNVYHPDLPKFDPRAAERQVNYLKGGNWSEIESPSVQQAIKNMGHDSFWVNEGGQKNLGIYDPNQIKSAIGNRGTYDFTNPDITKAEGGPVKTKKAKIPLAMIKNIKK